MKPLTLRKSGRYWILTVHDRRYICLSFAEGVAKVRRWLACGLDEGRYMEGLSGR